jgi:hypothetical protein
VKRDFRSSFDEKGGKYSIILPSMKYLQCDARNPNHIRIVLNESLSHILVMFSKDYFGLPCGIPRPDYLKTRKSGLLSNSTTNTASVVGVDYTRLACLGIGCPLWANQRRVSKNSSAFDRNVCPLRVPFRARFLEAEA